MNDIKNEYRCVTDLVEVKAYLGAAKIVSFDYETAPDDGYRAEDKAALDAAKKPYLHLESECQRAYGHHDSRCPQGRSQYAQGRI